MKAATTTPVQKGFVTTEGDDLYYEVRGQGEPLLLIPGARGNGDVYAPVADILCDEYKVITYDRRANSRSTMHEPEHFEIAQQSRDIVAVLHAVGEESAFIFGNSSGGVIALDLAATQPQAVRAVIVHEPPLTVVHPEAEKWQQFYASVYASAFRFGSTFATLRFLFGTGLPVWATVQTRRKVRGQIRNGGELRISPQATTEYFVKHEVLPVSNYVPDIEAILNNGVKVIMAAGQLSLDRHYWYAETAPILAEQLGCECVIFPGHHVSFMDQHVAWADLLRSIFREAEGITA